MNNKDNIWQSIYKKHSNALVFWLLFFAFYLPIGSFFLASAALLLYVFWPLQSYIVEVPQTTSKNIVVISHGLKDSNQTWATKLKGAIEHNSPDSNVVAIDWSPYAGNAFTCAVNGRRIGNQIAETLIDSDSLANVKVVGHSCGAFVNFGICEGLKAHKPRIEVESVFLDPVSVYGGIRWNFGLNNFGSCADKSMTIFDTEDNVPGSNQAPKYSKGIDVTDLKQQYDYSGTAHQWPIYYYIQQVKSRTSKE